MKFKVKDDIAMNGIHIWYVRNYIGCEFTPEKIEVCPHQGHERENGCEVCPGLIQAPWMKNPECFGFGGQFVLETFYDKIKVKRDFKRYRNFILGY
jgi:hypothetical protein